MPIIIPGPPEDHAHYTTPDELRGELDVDTAVLGDDAAQRLIVDAEDVIDSMLGAWWPDETTGRKITYGDVEAWQWAKLDRAAAKLAARIYRDPQLLTRRDYDRVKGPDFEREGGHGAGIVDASIMALLDQSGLRRLTGRAVTCRRHSMRPEYDRFLTATRHNGT